MDTTSYEEWLLARGLGTATIYNYRGKLVKAARIAGEQGWELGALTASQTGWVASQFPDSHSTQNMLRIVLTHYWSMVGYEGPIGAVTVPDPPPPEYRGLADADADRLEATATGWWPHGTAVMLGLYLALRRSEIAALRWDSFDRQLSKARITGKGRHTRILPIHSILREELASLRSDGYVFPGRSGAHVHHGTVRAWIGEVTAAVELEITNPHALRYTCATRLYEETGDIHMVQRFLGHADSQTTARYLTRVNEEKMRQAVEKISYRKARHHAA